MSELVKGEGPIPCKGMIIGMNPGEQEEIEGRPFVGKSGQLLDEVLVEAGLDRADLYVTNVYKVRTPGNRVPTKEETELHLDILLDEIDTSEADTFLLLGNYVVQTFFPRLGGITSIRGSVVEKARGCFIPTYHPSYVLRNGGVSREQFQYDVNLFAEFLNG